MVTGGERGDDNEVSARESSAAIGGLFKVQHPTDFARVAAAQGMNGVES